MKKIYETPEMETIQVGLEDLVMQSACPSHEYNEHDDTFHDPDTSGCVNY